MVGQLVPFLNILTPNFAYAATTATLIPDGQGTYTSWTGDEGDIDETGSVNCGSSDGSENISESTTDDRESVLIDLSSIPNGSTITSVDVVGCYANEVNFNSH